MYGVPPKQLFMVKSTIRKRNPFSVVTNKTAAAVQIGVGMTTDSVFFFQKLNGVLFARLRLIESIDAIFAMGNPASGAQFVIKIRLRDRKNGGYFVLRLFKKGKLFFFCGKARG